VEQSVKERGARVNRLPWWEQGALIIALVFVFGGLGWLLADGPVTGMFTQEVTIQMIEKQITTPEMFTLEVGGTIKSVRLWGSITGDKADVWLVNQRDERLKVFTTVPTGMAGITGMTVSNSGTRILDGVCKETCLIPASFTTKEYRVIIQVDDKTIVNVQRFEVAS
jgi:hypothetical protein